MKASSPTAYRLHKPELAKVEFCEPVTTPITEHDEQVWTNPPTIEQLAAEYRNRNDYADRKQVEADAAKADADAKLSELLAAGKAIGLVLSVSDADTELVITDWRELMVGDIVEIVGSENERWLRFKGAELFVIRTGTAECYIAFRSHDGDEWRHGGNTNWRFIRRP